LLHFVPSLNVSSFYHPADLMGRRLFTGSGLEREKFAHTRGNFFEYPRIAYRFG
jgi:hypothetical protein